MTGFHGRIAVYEVMPMDEELRALILDGASSTALKKTAIASGMITLRQSALTKVQEGMTTISEVVRVTMPD
jgi:type IV pilus assembly protein PilB